MRDDALPGLLAHGLHGGAVLCDKHFCYGVGKLAGVEKSTSRPLVLFLINSCTGGVLLATMAQPAAMASRQLHDRTKG